MIREHKLFFRRFLLVVDLIAITIAFFLSFEVVSLFQKHYVWNLVPSRIVVPRGVSVTNHLHYLVVILPVFAAILNYSGIYNSLRRTSVFDIVWLVVSVVLFAAGVFSALAFAFGLQASNLRMMLLTFVGLSIAILCIEKISIFFFVRHFRKKGYNFRNVLIVGTNQRAIDFARRVESHDEWGYRVIGFVDKENLAGERLPYPLVGELKDISRILREKVIDLVAFVVPRSWIAEIGSYIQECETQGKEVTLAVDLFNQQVGQVKIDDFAGMPVLQFETTFLNKWQVFVKRFLDIVISGVAIVVLAPVMLAVAIFIKLSSPDGPVFFIQRRCGLNGRVFNLLKFRSMVPNAEQMLDELMAMSEQKGPAFKMQKDPRLIKGGAFIRKFSLDELPQLFNVFVGHMSLVGPRPPIPKEVEQYKDWYRRRLSVRPGITCLWQVKARNKVGFEEWMDLDLKYIDDWSLWLDLKIMFQTIPAVIWGTGK